MSEEEQIILPDGFKRVEYLESAGSQWLNLSITTKAGDKIVLETESKFLDTSNQAEGKNGNPYFFYGINNGKWYCGAGGYSTSSITADTEWHKFRLIHSQNDTGLYIDNIKIQSQTYNSTSIVLNGTINAYRTYNGTYYHKTRKKSWKLYINDEIVYNLIPCLDHNDVPCMYNIIGTGTIEENTYYNQGTGKFLIPKDFEWNYPFINSDYNLPAGFKKCVYLQSDGTQWIDTGVIPDNETGLYFKALQLSYGDLVPFGVNDGGNEIHPPRFANKNLYYRWGTSSVKMMTWDKADDLIFHSSLNLYDSKIAKFDSEDTDVVTNITSQTGNYTLPIWLFSYNYRGAYNSTYGKWVGRVYRAQITQGADLIHDYVPCLDANCRPCMYDIIGGGTVEDNTYYNQSGGTEFAYCVEHQLPSDFIKLKYLESTGTQYINIGIIPTNETGLYVDAQQITHTNSHVISSGVDTNSTGFGVPRFLKGTANSCGFMWKGWNSYGNIGNGTRFESCLNLYNDRKATLKTAGTTERNNTLGELGFTPTVPLHAFRGNYASAGNWNGRIYRAKITQGSELVRDFVPAFDELKVKPCMYDLINNVAYYNDGSGEFLYSRDFEGNYKGSGLLGGIGNKLGCVNFDPELPRGYKRVAYLESTGTQFINTELDIVGLSVEVTFRGYNYAGGDGLAVCGADAGSANRFIITVNTDSGVGYHYLVSNAGEYSWGGIGGLKFGDFGTAIIDSHNKIMSVKSGNKFSQKIIEDKYLPTQSAYCHLFTRGSYLTGHNSYYNAQAKIYSFKANYAGVPAANYIPCLDHNNKPCMFDLITQQPFYNKGNGEDFKYGLF